jgi:hypothetical protein
MFSYACVRRSFAPRIMDNKKPSRDEPWCPPQVKKQRRDDNDNDNDNKNKNDEMHEWSFMSHVQKMQHPLPFESLVGSQFAVVCNEDYSERCRTATKQTMKRLKAQWELLAKELKEREEEEDAYSSDISLPWIYERFVKALPYCVPLYSGFHGRSRCYCPLGPGLDSWRKKCDLKSIIPICDTEQSREGFSDTSALLAHLKRQKTEGMDWHGIALQYLKFVYGPHIA